MAKRKSRPVASESRLFILALGLLVGFVIAFVILLSRLPVDSVISQYNADTVVGAEAKPMNFDYYAVLQQRKAAARPEAETALPEPTVVFVEPPASERADSPVPAPQPLLKPVPRVQQPVVKTPAQPSRESAQAPQPEPPPAQSLPPLKTPPPPAVLSTPQASPRPSQPAQRSAPVREMLASEAGQDSYYIEAASFADSEDAVRAQVLLRGIGLEAFIVVRQDNRGGFGHRVRIGPFLDQSRLDDARARLRARGMSPKLIRVRG